VRRFNPLLLAVILLVGALSADEYVAFSLKVAQQRVEAGGPDWRETKPDVFYLGGMTKVVGLVYDRQNNDPIIVGERILNRAPLTLDDLVVALRSRLVRAEWPEVSIDPTLQTEKTKMQVVRFEGGVENTQFGLDLFEADLRLKKLGWGLIQSGVSSVMSHWDLCLQRYGDVSGSRSVVNRFWFRPVLNNVCVLEDVAAFRELKIGVFTEVLSAAIDGKKIGGLSSFHDPTADAFVEGIRDHFDELAEKHPSFSRVRGLLELVGLASAIQLMKQIPDLSYWLREYEPRRVATPRQLEELVRSEKLERTAGGIRSVFTQEFSGGVQLMALALGLKKGVVTALRDAVLKTRPGQDALTWGFLVGDWVIPLQADSSNWAAALQLRLQVVFLLKQERYVEAVSPCDRVVELLPDEDWPYRLRGFAYEGRCEYERAIADYTSALERNPSDPYLHYLLGDAYRMQGCYARAESALTTAVKVDSMLAAAHLALGHVYKSVGDIERAVSCYLKALTVDPLCASAWCAIGSVHFKSYMYRVAASDFDRALQTDSTLSAAYLGKAVACRMMGEGEVAINAYRMYLSVAPMTAVAGDLPDVDPTAVSKYFLDELERERQWW